MGGIGGTRETEDSTVTRECLSLHEIRSDVYMQRCIIALEGIAFVIVTSAIREARFD